MMRRQRKVYRHEALDQLLWGPAFTQGRSSNLDRRVYAQFFLFIIVFYISYWIGEVQETRTVRLIVLFISYLIYFRNVRLFSWIILPFSMFLTYGDIILPLRTLIKSSHPMEWKTTSIVSLYTMILFNNIYLFSSLVRGTKSRRHTR